MSASEASTLETVRGLVRKADQAELLNAQDSDQILSIFEQYECWAPYFRLLKRVLQNPARRRLKDYVRLARVQNLYLEDVFAAAETSVALVSDLQLPFQKFSEDFIPKVIEFEDYAAEATLLSAVVDRLARASDQVACLERLCMIYEKKTHNETLLSKTYERLLNVDPLNVKALRYFKLAFTQNNEWEEVAQILRTLLSAVRHPQELFRVAQELAAISLYQLDQAEEAVRVLDAYCVDSPLDSSTILFDAYQRLGDWHGCLKVLRQCLLSADQDYSRAVMHLKIGSLHEQLGELGDAQDNYARAARLAPDLLDAIEGVVGVAVARHDWAMVIEWLQVLGNRVANERLKGQLFAACARLSDAMKAPHAPR